MTDPVPSLSLSAIVRADVNHTRGPLDRNLYRRITIPDGLQCILASDADPTMAEEEKKEKENERRAGNEGGEGDDGEEEGEEDGSSSSFSKFGEAPRNEIFFSAAALAVGTDSFSDPHPDGDGLALYLERVLFVRTATNPEEPSFGEYLSTCSG
uniref:Uncharacterized protein n=1 Tax=Corethron hystrix TaxID=216773 RepID=A0A7S1BX73_9STRA